MAPDSVTIIGQAVAADARKRQPSDLERTLATRMLAGIEIEAGQLLTTGCDPSEEVEPLTYERIAEMAGRVGRVAAEDEIRERFSILADIPPTPPMRRDELLKAMMMSC
ncbi:hypothetical protein [Halomonas sp. OfavH-34-E]|uniref:hypothetical protein n=1 Tax=Halomonas sp. OfavH-34-E TaxID=2954491 RepID=UPI002097DF3C|nr:hypothetical protein [Halomonas sp. OfavH-34-E]MCO7216866.1 hypothetical protein [Halomonas sp. OfavH-34-E]